MPENESIVVISPESVRAGGGVRGLEFWFFDLVTFFAGFFFPIIKANSDKYSRLC